MEDEINRAKLTAIVNQTLGAADECLARTQDFNVKILENVYEILCESRPMYNKCQRLVISTPALYVAGPRFKYQNRD